MSIAIDDNSVVAQQRVNRKVSRHMPATWLVLARKYKGYVRNI